MEDLDHRTTVDHVFQWTPRIVSILFVAFISIFAFDVFDEYQGWNLVFALFMHLVPSLILLATIIIAWKYDILGAIVFFGFAIFYIIWSGLDRPWIGYVLISGPAMLISVLYLMSWVRINRQKK